METKVCTRCGEEKSIDDFYWSHNNRTKEPYRRSECIPCFNKKTQARRKVNVLKNLLKRRMKESSRRAIMRMLQDDLSLVDNIINSNPLKYKRYLAEERNNICQESMEMALKYGKRAGHDINLLKQDYEKAMVLAIKEFTEERNSLRPAKAS
jgi:hypothetical protein